MWLTSIIKFLTASVIPRLVTNSALKLNYAFVDKKSIKKDTEWKLWPLEKIFAMYFCGNKHLHEMSLSLFSFQFSKGGL